MDKITTTGREASMRQPYAESRADHKPKKKIRTCGTRLADRLAERREAAITAFLESDDGFWLLGVERVAREILRWAAVRGSHLDLVFIEINPYALGRPEGPRVPLAGSDRLDYHPRYLRDVLSRMAEHLAGIELAKQGSRGKGLASVFRVPVLGPSLAELKREAQQAKIAAQARAKDRALGATKCRISAPSPSLNREDYPTTNPSTAVAQSHREKALPELVHDKWQPYFNKIIGVLNGIKGRDNVDVKILSKMLNKTTIKPANIVPILESAGRVGELDPAVRDPRRWALKTLTNDDFANRFSAPLGKNSDEFSWRESREGVVSNREEWTTDRDLIENIMATEGIHFGSKDAIINSLKHAGINLSLLPFLIKVGNRIIQDLSCHQEIGNRQGFLVYKIKKLEPDFIEAAKRLQADSIASQKIVHTSLKDINLEGLSKSFIEFNGVKNALDYWALARKKLSEIGGDAPNFLEVLDAKTSAEKALAELAMRFLDREAAGRVEAAVRASLEGIQPESRIWNFLRSYRIQQAALRLVGVPVS